MPACSPLLPKSQWIFQQISYCRCRSAAPPAPHLWDLWLSPPFEKYASTMWNFGHRSWLPQRVVFATWDFCRFSWSPSLCGTFVASVGRETFVASVGRLRYVGPLLLQLVASTTWNLWSLQLHGTCGRFSYVGSITSVGCLCFVFGCFRNVVSSYLSLWDLGCLQLRETFGRLQL